MRKVFLILGLLVFLLVSTSKDASAALITMTHDGEVYWNVLGLTDSSLEVKKIADNLVTTRTSISLANNDGKITISYDGGKEVEITDYKEDILEVEEKEASSTVIVKASDSGFAIEQNGTTAWTSFPIKVNSLKHKLSVETKTGEKFLAVLPYDAVNQLIRTNIISVVNEGGTVLTEKDEGEVIYLVSGKKNVMLFNIFALEVPVAVEISAVTGTVLKVDQPVWYSVVDFLLV